jgi:hypothetical protein
MTLLNHCPDILDVSDIYILHRNDSEHEKSYEILKSEFTMVNFVEEQNFKEDLLKIVHNESNISWGSEPPYMGLNNKNSPYMVVFITDDSVFTADFSMKEVISTLVENKDCIGFSLRLGRNTRHCYPYNCKQKVPELENVKDNIYKFNWEKSEYDFAYSLELSSSAYRLIDIIAVLISSEYSNPNFLESNMDQFSKFYRNNKLSPTLLCFETSVAFSDPLNRVNATHPNRSGNVSEDKLMELFLEGYRVDGTLFNGFISSGAHELVDIRLKG